jgi:alkanesulfonate monooxygenase SsuD/methylene tetrahydromethanopterin reductase-like flavin-dependent oxidoreductase (luciferase family)
MHALTLDHLSGGRFVLGLGVSGPQVVEGWYGQPFASRWPHPRVRVGDPPGAGPRGAGAQRRPALPAAVHRRRSTGLGKPLRPITHPLRPTCRSGSAPRAAERRAGRGDRRRLAGRVPSDPAGRLFEEWLAEGLARPGARRRREDFEVVTNCQIVVTDDPAPSGSC